ncbi:hypothetical protein GUITHDRAFT_136225 [Guillardia theta CCMP2712]|uniref:Uncharacterized protein n=1 Tax=Guillardia theta (strain CCMP2712) TaxID=905079 RepID=L1JLN3_GUITC|nr:hypothetical protein GUITHDRAFT_136225 [Guillardia theta CCMP2712]EKX49040.1 hypothetical protein GUITHDRAFT_136225 [Guillardia theta CCMP2712]|eukprot:XP_005836020.1 hypothetical protein GUITHDRAFT_136225 [Guillardia theta CCMP2712]
MGAEQSALEDCRICDQRRSLGSSSIPSSSSLFTSSLNNHTQRRNPHSSPPTQSSSTSAEGQSSEEQSSLVHHGLGPLHQAAATDDDLQICLLVEKLGFDVNITDDFGRTRWSPPSRGNFLTVLMFPALHAAAFTGSLRAVKCLIRLGANLDSMSIDGKTPLVCAAEQRHTLVLRSCCNLVDLNFLPEHMPWKMENGVGWNDLREEEAESISSGAGRSEERNGQSIADFSSEGSAKENVEFSHRNDDLNKDIGSGIIHKDTVEGSLDQLLARHTNMDSGSSVWKVTEWKEEKKDKETRNKTEEEKEGDEKLNNAKRSLEFDSIE